MHPSRDPVDDVLRILLDVDVALMAAVLGS